MKKVTLDILAFGAHPDDVDACAGGTIIASAKQGKKVGIIDLTAGEDNEQTTGEVRLKEAENSAKILGLKMRKNLKLPERDIYSKETENILVKEIRLYRPEVIIAPYWKDRHKGHRDTSLVLERAIQLAKYSKILPDSKPHKVKLVVYYMIHYEFKPTFIFNISENFDTKIKALYCHKSQLFIKKSRGHYTNKLIDPNFIEAWNARSRWLGYTIGEKYGEGFAMKRQPGINNLHSLTNRYL